MKKKIGYLSVAFISAAILGNVMTADAEALTSKPTTGEVTFKEGELTISPKAELPDNLDFGYHKIQNSVAENWFAEDPSDPMQPMQGKIIVDDLRGSQAGWNLKLKQNDQFKAGANELTGAEFSLTLANPKNEGGTEPGTILVGKTVFTPTGANSEKTLISAADTQGNGTTTVDVPKFELSVPAKAPKVADTYETSFTWTLSDAP